MGTESPVGTHGKVLTGVRTRSLIASDGGVRGAECVLADGTVRRIEARWTLLATGGFQADPELRAEHIHPQARGIALRSNPYSAGDGLRLGFSAGRDVRPGRGGLLRPRPGMSRASSCPSTRDSWRN